MKSILFLRKFITKIIFNSKHFNYNIHFLNIVSMRWRLLSTHSPQAFLEVLHHSLQHVGRKCCHLFPNVLFQVHHCLWFLFLHLALEISSDEEVLRLGTLDSKTILAHRVSDKELCTHNVSFFHCLLPKVCVGRGI